jgi:His Kinase A (phospho-acceptor) domain
MLEPGFPTISSLVALGEYAQETLAQSKSSDPITTPDSWSDESSGLQSRRAEGEWQAALVALRHLLLSTESGTELQGVLLSGPLPVVDQPILTAHLSNWTFVPQPLEQLSLTFSQLMPAEGCKAPTDYPSAARVLTLLEGDPLVAERFCLLLTRHFGLVLVLGADSAGDLHFQFSFTPTVVQSVWQLLRTRVAWAQPKQLEVLEPLVAAFSCQSDPDYRLVGRFSRSLLSALPPLKVQEKSPEKSSERPVERMTERMTERHSERHSDGSKQSVMPAVAYATAHYSKLTDEAALRPTAVDDATPAIPSDTDLLKAMAHEIRTPLSTILTLTRSLLRRQDFDPKVLSRLKQIDRECTQQINRFNLIFKAAELDAATSKLPRSPLSATSLSQLFQEATPQWQEAAARRNLTLAVNLPARLPTIVSDPALLQQVLTGLVELFTHSVPPDRHIQLEVMLAGHQLKLQFQALAKQTHQKCPDPQPCPPPPLRSLGNVLMFQPETGGLSLNLDATKSLFKALGAKLIVRERATQGSTWAVFLPLETAEPPSIYPIV